MVSKSEFNYKYELSSYCHPIIIKSNNTYVLTDFDRSSLLNPYYRQEYDTDYYTEDFTITLPPNIKKSRINRAFRIAIKDAKKTKR